MDSNRIETITRRVARRFSRRAPAAPRAAKSVRVLQDPGSADEVIAREDSAFLFVQIFEAGTWAPKPDEDGVFELTLTGHAAQTVYFSDRPERVVGAVPTGAFLDGLGFTPTNPPNAALVAQTAAGENVVVVELFNPVYTEFFGDDGATTLTYEVRLLAGYEGAGLAHLAAQQTGAELPEQFGAASLFVDDCPDITNCVIVGNIGDSHETVIGPIPDGPWGRCWNWNDLNCDPCSHPESFYDDLCNQTYSACNGQCRPD